LEFLNNKNPRHLELLEKSPDFKRLEKILSRVRVTVKTDKKGSRPKIIRGLVPQGGKFQFVKGGDNTTVEVRPQFVVLGHNSSPIALLL